MTSVTWPIVHWEKGVDLPKILDIMENSDFDSYIMAELDRGRRCPSAEEAVQRNAEYLRS